MTPLFDAVGRAIHDIEKAKETPDERIALVILTDGLEQLEIDLSGIAKGFATEK